MYEYKEFHFGVSVNIKINTDLLDSEIAPFIEKTFLVFEKFEHILSRDIKTSELSRLNDHRGRAMVVSESLFELLYFALSLSKKSHGAFDPCVSDFLDAYGYKNNRPFNIYAIRALKNRRSSFRHVMLDPNTRTVQLLPSQRVDLDAFVKGYVIDLAAQILLFKFEHFCIDAGGDILAVGHAENLDAWPISILNPFDDVGGFVRISLLNKGLATTTSMGEQKVMIINPITGELANELVNVTVIAPSAFRADSLATTAFVLGLHQGLALLEQEPNVEGMIITQDRSVMCTTGMKEYFIEHQMI